MTWFTIDIDNNITAYPTVEDAQSAATRYAFADESSFKTILEENGVAFANEIWNSIPGAKKRTFKTAKAAAPAIWKQLQTLVPTEEATVRAPRAQAASKKPKASKKAAAPKKAPKTPKAAKPVKEASSGLREGSKAAQVVEMLKRENGATLDAIMKKFGWQSHTTRALMSAGGSLAKAGFKIESFKTEKGDRAYRIA